MKAPSFSNPKLKSIRRKLKVSRYSKQDFLAVCPFTMEELSNKDRHTDVLAWRHVAITWHLLSGDNLSGAGRSFNRDHATAINSLNQVHSAVLGFGMPQIRDAIEHIVAYVGSTETLTIPKDRIAHFLSMYFDDSGHVDELTEQVSQIVNNKKPLI